MPWYLFYAMEASVGFVASRCSFISVFATDLEFEMEGYGCDMLQVSVNTELDPFLDSFDSREE